MMPNYQVYYDFVYDGEDYVAVSKKFPAPNDASAPAEARRIIRNLDRRARKEKGGSVRVKLVSVETIRGRKLL